MAKAEFKDIMINILSMVEEICEKYPIQSQEYYDICDQFKNANLKFDDLMGAVNQLKDNSYYNDYVRDGATREHTILTDDQKSKCKNYTLCNCGCYINKNHLARHKHTDKHYKLVRNKKLASKKGAEDISNEINTEVKLSALMINKKKIIDGLEGE